MTLLVVSDIHDRSYRLSELLDKHPKHDGFLFLGDGLRSVEREADRITGLAAVSGNCDGLSFTSLQIGAAQELLLDLDGVRVLMMHGHKYGVKVELSRAIARADDLGADVLLFGHTHIPFEKELAAGSEVGSRALKKRLFVFNPGALENGSFGLLTVKDGAILLSHGRV